MPGVDCVWDFTYQSLPFADNSISHIYARHVIEHIPFREFERVIKSWRRVLIPGGTLQIIVPCAIWMAEAILANKDCRTQGEYDGLMKILEFMFGGQYHPGNFHHWAYTPALLCWRLRECGFPQVILDTSWQNPTEVCCTAVK